MIDQNTKEQLVQVFANLENNYEFIIKDANDTPSEELKSLLNAVAETSEKISTKTEPAEKTSFQISRNSELLNITFKMVPGGHEFTSLILAVLHADKKGKWPDDGIINRIKSLKGPIKLRTYISLSCTNCPDVVQALNQMSLVHSDFEHEVIDGSINEEEVNALNLQGVPAVFSGDKMLHVGKASLNELLDKLVTEFGTEDIQISTEPQNFDVIIAGGGPAGAAAAIYSSRKGLKVALVAERMGGQVKDTKGIENLISQTYIEGPVLAENIEKHLRENDIIILEHREITSLTNDEEKVLTLSTGEKLSSPALIIATGAKWRKLNVPGETEYIGRGVAFCPHCDGPFYKDADVAVIGGGNSGVEAAIDLSGICKKVTLIEFLDNLKADHVLIDAAKKIPNIEIHTNHAITEVVGNGNKVTGILVKNRANDETRTIDVSGIFVQIGLVPNSDFAKGVVKINNYGEIEIDSNCRTNVPGIYAAGDVSTVPYKQIVISMGEGAKAALTAFDDRVRGLL